MQAIIQATDGEYETPISYKTRSIHTKTAKI